MPLIFDNKTGKDIVGTKIGYKKANFCPAFCVRQFWAQGTIRPGVDLFFFFKIAP